MPQTGTGSARALKVLRSRLSSLWTEGPIWFPEDTSFVPPAYTQGSDQPSSFLRIEYGPQFEVSGSATGASDGVGSWSFIFACQPRRGMNAEIERAEVEIRAIADGSQNDNSEDVWTLGQVEVRRGVSPRVPRRIADSYYFTQFVVQYKLMEGFIATASSVDPSTWTNKVLLLNWDSASVLTDASGVHTWGDDSGESNDFTQSTNSDKPSLSGKVIFDGSTDRMTGPVSSTLIGSAYTCVWAINVESCSTDHAGHINEGWCGDPSAWWGFTCRSSNRLGLFHWDGAAIQLTQTVSSVTGDHIVAVRWSGTKAYLRVDDNSWTSMDMGAPDNLLGATNLAKVGTMFFDGGIYNAVWSSDLKSESEVDDVVAFYNAELSIF